MIEGMEFIPETTKSHINLLIESKKVIKTNRPEKAFQYLMKREDLELVAISFNIFSRINGAVWRSRKTGKLYGSTNKKSGAVKLA